MKSVLIIIFCFISIMCFSCKKESLLKGNYQNYVGYLDPSKTYSPVEYQLCGDSIYGTHHGLPKLAYKPNKGIFDEYIQEHFPENLFKDSGYLNFRFIVNCKGQVGRVAIIESTLDLEKTSHLPALVDTLKRLTIRSENWIAPTEKGIDIDYYMYVSYKIENGKIKEILP